MIVTDLDDVAVVPEHVALVRLTKPYRPVMSLRAHGWRVYVVLKSGAEVCVKSWGAPGDGPSAEPQDALDELEARHVYGRIIESVRWTGST